MNLPHLYELADARSILSEWLDESEGEITPELEALLADLDGSVDTKIERTGLFIRELQADAERIKIEEDRLHARRKAREKAADSLKNYLLVQMEKLGKDKVKGTLLTVALQASPPAVTSSLDDETMEELWHEGVPGILHIPESFRVDRGTILQRVRDGLEIPEGIAVTQSRHIRLR